MASAPQAHRIECTSAAKLTAEHAIAEAVAAQLAARTQAARAAHRPLERRFDSSAEGQRARPRASEASRPHEKRQRCDDAPGSGELAATIARALGLLSSGLTALREAAGASVGGAPAPLAEEVRAQLLVHVRQVEALATPATRAQGDMPRTQC